jgi:hypothetical protein
MEMIEDKIRKRAYEIYIRRTQTDVWDYGRLGTPEGDWSQAEREVLLEEKAVINRIKDLV